MSVRCAAIFALQWVQYPNLYHLARLVREEDHMNVGYNSADAGQVHRQVEDMMSRGIQGAIAAWYGPTNRVIENATMLLKSEAEAKLVNSSLRLWKMSGSLGSAAVNNRCDVTDQLISDFSYVATQYESSSAYMKMNGRPVVFFFGVDGYFIDWNRVVSSIPGNPMLIFQGTSGLNRAFSDGAFSWITSTRRILTISIWQRKMRFIWRPGRSATHYLRIRVQRIQRYARHVGHESRN